MTDTFVKYQEKNTEIENAFALHFKEFVKIQKAHEAQNNLVIELQRNHLSLFQEFIKLSQKINTHKYADISEANKWVAEMKKDFERYKITNQGQANAQDMHERISHKDLLQSIRKSLQKDQRKFAEVLRKNENNGFPQPLVRSLILEIVRLQEDNINLLNYFCAIHVRRGV